MHLQRCTPQVKQQYRSDNDPSSARKLADVCQLKIQLLERYNTRDGVSMPVELTAVRASRSASDPINCCAHRISKACPAIRTMIIERDAADVFDGLHSTSRGNNW
jgi:hypothetical protein